MPWLTLYEFILISITLQLHWSKACVLSFGLGPFMLMKGNIKATILWGFYEKQLSVCMFGTTISVSACTWITQPQPVLMLEANKILYILMLLLHFLCKNYLILPHMLFIPWGDQTLNDCSFIRTLLLNLGQRELIYFLIFFNSY